MAISNGRAPKHGGSPFSSGTGARPSARPAESEPISSTGAIAPRSALASGSVSRRTAAATKRAKSGQVIRADRPRRNTKIGIIVAVLVAVFAVVSLVVFVIVPSMTPSEQTDGTQTITPGNQVTISIPEGSGAAAVAQILSDNGIIADQGEFLAQARRMEAESSLMSGSYTITTGADLADIVTLLTTGPNATTAQLVIPEGYTVSQIAATVDRGHHRRGLHRAGQGVQLRGRLPVPLRREQRLARGLPLPQDLRLLRRGERHGRHGDPRHARPVPDRGGGH